MVRRVAPSRTAHREAEEKKRWRFAGTTDIGKRVLQNPADARGGTRTSRRPRRVSWRKPARGKAPAISPEKLRLRAAEPTFRSSAMTDTPLSFNKVVFARECLRSHFRNPRGSGRRPTRTFEQTIVLFESSSGDQRIALALNRTLTVNVFGFCRV